MAHLYTLGSQSARWPSWIPWDHRWHNRACQLRTPDHPNRLPHKGFSDPTGVPSLQAVRKTSLVALGAIIGKDEAHPAAVKKQQDGGQHQGDLINGARYGEQAEQ